MYSKKIMENTAPAAPRQDPPKRMLPDPSNQTADLNMAEMSGPEKCEEAKVGGWCRWGVMGLVLHLSMQRLVC